ncbi:hypothetical protein B0H34DRAFT_714691 [Crassisporium funariophilum]|nr:hypothetical protein B0H34DRAFT_714691 [Crassisporium funariophilum]
MTSSTNVPANHSSVVPSEVGWQFVPQYYTFVNKEPHRLHCFYNKNSTFIHGTEGEEIKPCYGQQEIHNKITSIGFEDCKVFIHSVDAQSSANGGIIIQVIGEMSNHGDPWRKFVQTFFLAEQPNGYFVLNDIFRFLKEETIEGDDVSDTAEVPEPAPVAAIPEPVPAPVAVPEPTYEPPREPTPAPPPVPVVAEPVPAPPVADEAPTTDVSEPLITQTPTPAPEQQAPSTPAAQPNGIHTPEPEKAAPVVSLEPPAAPTPASRQASPAPPVPAPAAAAPVAPAPAAVQAPPAPAPTPAAPAAPRSWASLAASNPKKWGSAVAQESRGTTETLSVPAPSIPPPAPAAQAPPAAAQRPHGAGHPGQQGNRQDHPALQAAQSVSTAQCFVKGVTEPISQTLLQTTLTQRFGAIKDLEIVRAKACAFIEFVAVDSAKRAIIASLNQHQGGEGGVWLDVGGEVGQVRISVETKKERGDRPVSRPRGGAPVVNGEGRGGAQGGGGGGSFRGRGGPNRGRGAPPVAK